jgi:peptide/nickel transport system permease protein
MLMYTVRRILATIPVLLAATLFTFFLVDLSGDPIAPLRTAIPPVPEETIIAVQERLYLDRSIFERYWLWLTGIGETNGDIGLLQGKWGPSVRGNDISADIAERFWITFRLVGFATVAAICLAVVTGVISAIRQYSKTDHALTFVGFLALAMPTFWLAALIKEAGVWLNREVFERQIFFTIRATSPGYSQMDFWERVSDVAGHAILPTLTLMLTGYALISRFQRASMLEVLNSDYVRLARAKGLRNRTVMRRHALRTALIPVVTLAALTVSGALTGSVVVELVFGWRGLGTYFLSALGEIDTYAIMGFIVFSGVLVVLANLVADLLYGVLDPRIRYE